MTTTSTQQLNKKCSEEQIEIFEEVINLLDRFHLFHTTILVSEEKGSQNIPATIALVNPHTKEFTLRPLHTNNPFPNFKEQHLKIKNELGNISFISVKGSIGRSNFLNIKIPSIITIMNYRDIARIDLAHKNLKIGHTNYTSHDFQMNTYQLQSQLVDTSSSGIGLKSVNPTWGQLRQNDKITLNSFGTTNLNEKILRTIVYIKNIPNNILSSGTFHIGIRFNKNIELETLLKKINNES